MRARGTASTCRPTGTVQEVHVACYNLSALTLHSILFPALSLQTTHYHHLATLCQILGSQLSELSPSHNLVVFHCFFALTAAIHPSPVRSHRKRCHLLTTWRRSQLWIGR